MYSNTNVSTPIISVRGFSGNAYQFQVFEWDTYFKPIGAVYLVLRQQLSGHYAVLYASQTGNMSTQLDAHHKEVCFNRHYKTHVGVLPENSELRRLTIEADIVSGHHPVCNG